MLADYSQLAVPFAAYALPIVDELSPASGPVNGDTAVVFTGTGLARGSRRQCAFNRTLVNASSVDDERLLCLVPPSLIGAGPLSVSISLNGQQFSRLALRFQQYEEPRVLSLSPAVGHATGGTTVQLHGDHLLGGTDRFCRFGALSPVNAVPVPGSPSATCLMPPSADTVLAPLQLSLNGQQYTAATSAARFEYLTTITQLVVSPASGPVNGDTLLRIASSEFAAGVHFLCRFRQPAATSPFSTTLVIVDAVLSASNSSELKCTPPAMPAGTTSLEVSLNGQQFSNSSLLYMMHTVPQLHSLSPSSGPFVGGTTVTLSATGLASGVHYLCRFVPPLAVAPVVMPAMTTGLESPEELVCITPAASAAWATTQVQATLNGQQFSLMGLNLSYYPPLSVSLFSPTSGPVGGATRVVLAGSGFLDTWELQCRFNRAVVNATFLSSSQLACISPPDSTAGLRSKFSANFSAAIAAGRLFGAAAVEGASVLVLTDWSVYAAGSLVLDLNLEPPLAERAVRSFEARFLLALAPRADDQPPCVGCDLAEAEARLVGDGVSFSFGDISLGLVSECGAGQGLRVLFRTSTHSRLEVLLAGQLLSNTSLTVPRNATAAVVILVTNSQLTVSLDSQPLLKLLPLHPWQPESHWRLALGARNGASAMRQQVSALSFTGSQFDDLGEVALEVSANTHDFTADAARFAYRAEPQLVTITPRTGSILGATNFLLAGSALRGGSDSRITLSNVTVHASWVYHGGDALLGVAPPLGSNTTVFVNVSVGLNAQQFTGGLDFGYFIDPRVDEVSPNTGSILGGTLVTLSGSDFSGGSVYRCRFGDTLTDASVSGEISDHLLCRLPPQLPATPRAVEVSLNGQEYSSSGLLFVVYDIPLPLSLSPSSGPSEGGTLVQMQVQGADLSIGSHYLCRFAVVVVNATYAKDDHRLHCYAPRANASLTPPAVVPVGVSLNGQDYSASAVTYSYYLPPMPTSTSPATGPELGSTTVRLSSALYGNGSDYRVLLDSFGSNFSVLVLSVPLPDHIEFWTPLAIPGVVVLRTSLNAQQYSQPDLRFTFYAQPSLTAISPSCGPLQGQTSVAITGTNLVRHGSHRVCEFGPLVDASSHGEAALKCISPNASARFRPFEVALNGQQYTVDGLVWAFTSTPRISSIWPVMGETGSNLVVTISGSGFSSACDARCNFTEVQVVQASYDVASGNLWCQPPSGTHLLSTIVEVSLNAQQYTADSRAFTYYDKHTVSTANPKKYRVCPAPCTEPNGWESRFVNMSMIDVQPSTSHIFGGTTVTLKGTGFLDYGTLQCKFGGGTVVQALFVNAAEIECVAPAISELGPAVSRVGLEASFDTAPDVLVVEGHAHVEGGVLKLTNKVAPKLQEPSIEGKTSPSDRLYTAEGAGWARTNFQPPQPELLGWQMHFEIFIGGGWGGDGFSVVYGALPDAALLKEAGGLAAYGVATNAPFNGLLVSFVTAANYLRVEYNGELIGLWEVRADALRTAAWTGIDLNYSPAGGLSIYHAGWSRWGSDWDAGGHDGATTEHIAIPGYAPQRGWQFALGASSYQWSDYHWVDNLRISSTWSVEGTAAYPLSLSQNGQTFHHVGQDVTYHAPPAVSMMIPGTGPIAGGTHLLVSGVYFEHGDNYKCRLGDVVINAQFLSDSLLECYTPQTSTNHHAHFAISLNNQQFTTDPVYFSYQPAYRVSFINPDLGPQVGGTIVLIHGSNFRGGDAYRCKFGQSKVVGYLFGDKAHGYYIKCTIPSLDSPSDIDTFVPVEVSINNQQYTGDAVQFKYFATQLLLGIEPSTGPTLGATKVLVEFESLQADTETSFWCSFGGRITYGILVDTTVVQCPSPATLQPGLPGEPFAGPVHLRVSTNGQDYTNAKTFNYYRPPSLAAVSPSSGPVKGDTLASITGANLINGSVYRCRYGDTESQTVLYTEAFYQPSLDLVMCKSADGQVAFGGSAVSLQVSLNAQQYTDDLLLFQYFKAPFVTALSPSTGPVEGGTCITLSGQNFIDGSNYRCRFSHGGVKHLVDATADQLSIPPVVRCYSPHVDGQGATNYDFQLSLNNQDFTRLVDNPAHFGYHGNSSLSAFSPSSGPVLGDTNITIAGRHLGSGSDYRCRFGWMGSVVELVVPAQFEAQSGDVTCVAPDSQGHYGGLPIEVTQNGQQYTDYGVFYVYYGPVAVSRLVPVAGPAQLDTTVLVWGGNFDLGSDYRCGVGDRGSALRFPELAAGRGVSNIPATRVNASFLKCRSPLASLSGALPVMVSLNGQQYTDTSANFFFFTPHHVLSVSPSSGSSLGSTTVTVTGTGFVDFTHPHPIECHFGASPAHTQLLDDQTLLCISPPATAAGYTREVRFDFEHETSCESWGKGEGAARTHIGGVWGVRADGTSYKDSTILAGHACARAGFLQLTGAHYFQTGSFVWDLGPRDFDIVWFALSADIYIGGGSAITLGERSGGGMGLSLCFGKLPDAPFGEFGAGDGLRLSFLTSNSSLLVSLASQPLRQVHIGTALRGARKFVLLEIVWLPSGLSVLLDGQSVVKEMPIELRGNTDWSFGVGARTGLPFDAHLVDNIMVRTGSYLSSAEVALEVTMNSDSFSSNAVGFKYLPPPAVSHLSVDRGPVLGETLVTVYGSNFAGSSHTWCRFSQSSVYAQHHMLNDWAVVPSTLDNVTGTSMRCYSPPVNASKVALEVTINGKDYTRSHVPFLFYEVGLSAANPGYGPRTGGSLTTVRGEGFAAGASYGRYYCRFTEASTHRAVHASFDEASDTLLCTSPCHNASGTSLLSVSLNGQQFSRDAIPLHLYDLTVAAVVPPYSIYHGNQTVQMTVHGLRSTTRKACKLQYSHLATASEFNASHGMDVWYGTSIVEGTTVAPEAFTCSTPSARDAGISRRLVLNFDQGVNLTSWLEFPDSPRPSSLPISNSSAESELQGDARIDDGRCTSRQW